MLHCNQTETQNGGIKEKMHVLWPKKRFMMYLLKSKSDQDRQTYIASIQDLDVK